MKLDDAGADGDTIGVMIVGACTLASIAALALWFSSELKTERHAGPRNAAVQTSAAGASATGLPIEAG